MLLQVGLMDTGKRFHNDSNTAQMTRLQSGVLAGGPFTIVFITDNYPANIFRLFSQIKS